MPARLAANLLPRIETIRDSRPNRLVVLVGVALEVQLCPFRDQTLAPLAAAILDDTTTGLGLHARTESVLLLATALGWLVGAFHG